MIRTQSSSDMNLRLTIKNLCWTLLICILSIYLVDADSRSRQRSAGAGSSSLGCPSATKSVTPDVEIQFPSPNKPELSITNTRQSTGWHKSSGNALTNSGFNLSLPTIMYVHGFSETGTSNWLLELRQKYAKTVKSDGRRSFNLLFFSYEAHSAQSSYGYAVTSVPSVGKTLGNFFAMLLKEFNYQPENVHLVGFSLGTHVAGAAGRYVTQVTGSQFSIITALDPTGVCFHDGGSYGKTHGLRASDARLVVARHYDINGLGAKRMIGGVDILVNGGQQSSQTQFGMRSNRRNRRYKRHSFSYDDEDTGESDHAMIVRGYTAHVLAPLHERRSGSNPGCHGVAYACKSYQLFLEGTCGDCGSNGDKCYYMDNFEDFQFAADGVRARKETYPLGRKMYIATNSAATCLFHYQVVARLNSNCSSSDRRSLENGDVKFKFNSGFTATTRYAAARDKYTALVTVKQMVRLPKRVTVEGSAHNSGCLRKLSLNFMSHPLKEKRDNQSASYCPNGTGGKLKKC